MINKNFQLSSDQYIIKPFDDINFNEAYEKPVIMLILRKYQEDEGVKVRIGHYVYFYSHNNILSYFDSFGIKPLELFAKYESIEYDKNQIDNFIKFIKNHEIIDYNQYKYQNENSSLCGCYCLLFLYMNYILRLKPDDIHVILNVLKYTNGLKEFDDIFN